MQHGDLATSVRPHYVVVLEGVLAEITPVIHQRRFRGDLTVGHNIHWFDLPLRRLATMQRRFQEVGAEIVTFTDADVADQAADFLNAAAIPHESLSYQSFDQFCLLLPFKDGLQAVYDSDESRLERYGQLGRAVIQGDDFF